ncbi:DUF2336 domain-containing protein [Hyphobacterium sp. HN65]|uniref:DUF2336 domain-containing protein n=1 Tax=Hyphobacterium lacteum TaxID=3116575 RepID=A0ABU7LTF1_9PROT|nr:DUF2336 domain-containing protein [Hyphobacterium sp. HN65]MEE2527179.1 DUF2336 domain-containing protein [Hyphobacterium sp. HN65]
MSISAMRSRLTDEDIRRLVKGENAEDRALAARKICQRIDAPDLTAEERQAADAIIMMIAQDAATLVRRSLAVTLRQSEHLPKDVAMKLAMDIDSIAVPVIAGSPVFTDEELIQIVRTQPASKQSAVAAREVVSKPVVMSLIDHADETAMGIAAANDGAEFDTEAYERTINRFADSRNVMDSFVSRSALPIEITEKIIARVSDDALQRLVRRHALPPQIAVDLAEGARERATVDLVDQAGVAPDLPRFVEQLQTSGRLTPSLILRALMRGHIGFFEHSLARLASVPHSKAWLLIHDAGPLGMKAIFERTGLPPRILPAIRAAIETYHSIEMGSGEEGRIVFRRRLVERSLTQFQGVPEEDLEYILSRLDQDEAEIQPAALAG